MHLIVKCLWHFPPNFLSSNFQTLKIQLCDEVSGRWNSVVCCIKQIPPVSRPRNKEPRHAYVCTGFHSSIFHRSWCTVMMVSWCPSDGTWYKWVLLSADSSWTVQCSVRMAWPLSFPYTDTPLWACCHQGVVECCQPLRMKETMVTGSQDRGL